MYSTSATSLSTQKPWAKPTGTYSSRMLSLVELDRLPARVGGRAAAQVDGDVEDSPARAAHELGDAVADVEVHAAQHPARRARVVVLHEPLVLGDPDLGVPLAPVGLAEEAPLVAVDARFDDHEAGRGGRTAARIGARG